MGFLDSLFGNPRRDVAATITDVTKMEQDRICIAAMTDGKSIRLNSPVPRENWLRSVGGLSPGDQISLSWRMARSYTPPHREDGSWYPSTLTKVGRLSENDVRQKLSSTAFRSLRKAFGKPLFTSPRGNPAFPPNRGSRSLASLVAHEVSVYPVGNGVRLDFRDDDSEWKMVPVEDLAVRNHRLRCAECASRLESLLKDEFNDTEAILRIGLGRRYRADGQEPACYLQVNHVFPMSAREKHFVLS